MLNVQESQRWLKDAEACLNTAQNCLSFQDYRAVTQNAQLCIEQSAKAIVACFEEPKWTHDPGNQLELLLNQYREKIVQKYGEEMFKSLMGIRKDVSDTFHWHGWSTYGRREKNGSWKGAVEVCTENIAKDLLSKAQRSYKTAKEFLLPWLST